MAWLIAVYGVVCCFGVSNLVHSDVDIPTQGIDLTSPIRLYGGILEAVVFWRDVGGERVSLVDGSAVLFCLQVLQ